jgi:hypothetical protein
MYVSNTVFLLPQKKVVEKKPEPEKVSTFYVFCFRFISFILPDYSNCTQGRLCVCDAKYNSTQLICLYR